MVIELVTEAAVAASDMMLASHGSKGMVGSALAGAFLGVVSPTEKMALITSLGAGAIVPLVSGAKVTPMNLALSMVTSTAIGLVAYKYSHMRSHRRQEEERREQKVVVETQPQAHR